MKNRNNQEIKLRPKAVERITIGFLVISMVVTCILLIQNGNLKKTEITANSGKDIKSQIIEKNMEIGEAEEGILKESITAKTSSLEKTETIAEVKNISGANAVVGVAGSSVDTSEWDTEKVDIVYDPTGIPVPVPKGFTASSVESEKYVNRIKC